MIPILAILGHLFPACIEFLEDFVRNRMAIAYDDGAFPSRHFLVLGFLKALISLCLCKFGNLPPPALEFPPVERALLPGSFCQTGRQMYNTSPSMMRIEIQP